ncbi:MAG: N-acetylmuramoyl-L-alanine amidase [Candidatus Poribacteria bacterium]|nr:N-acetylmuramoyl-L-alanine amidase [Candidatus Poribacteria bacterium]
MIRRSLLLLVLLLSGYGHFSDAQSTSIRFVDEGGKTLAEVEAVTQSEGLYFPIQVLRDVFDPNLKQQYSSLRKRLTLNLKGKRMRLQVGMLSVTVDPDGTTLLLSRPPLIVAGQPMLPLEFFTELIPRIYELQARYNRALQTIHIQEQTGLLPDWSASPTTAQQAEFLVIIDPGHGGPDTGCRGATGVLEKDIVLDLAKQIEAVCRRYQIGVVLTRDADIERRPTKRINVAKQNRGDLFLSLHGNASFSPQAKGIRLYINNSLGGLKSESSSAVSDEIPQRDTIIKALSQEDFLTQSRQFVAILQEELEAFSPSPIPLTESPLATLSGVYMPAVLVEIGYLTNEADETRLTDAEGIRSMAVAMGEALQRYITESDSVEEAENGQ